MTWTRLLLLPPLVSAALVGASGTAAEADDTGHDHSTMDHGTTQTHEHGTEPSTETHEHGTAPPKDRPLALVLGTFGGVNGAVVLGAALVRRRERAVRQAKQARRSHGRAVPAEVAE